MQNVHLYICAALVCCAVQCTTPTEPHLSARVVRNTTTNATEPPSPSPSNHHTITTPTPAPQKTAGNRGPTGGVNTASSDPTGASSIVLLLCYTLGFFAMLPTAVLQYGSALPDYARILRPLLVVLPVYRRIVQATVLFYGVNLVVFVALIAADSVDSSVVDDLTLAWSNLFFALTQTVTIALYLLLRTLNLGSVKLRRVWMLCVAYLAVIGLIYLLVLSLEYDEVEEDVELGYWFSATLSMCMWVGVVSVQLWSSCKRRCQQLLHKPYTNRQKGALFHGLFGMFLNLGLVFGLWFDEFGWMNAALYIIYPVALITVVLVDTRYWTHELPQLLQATDATLKCPLLNMSLGLEHSAPRLIPFQLVSREAYPIDRGAAAQVYKGMYRGEHVAVKLTTLDELTADTVKECIPMRETLLMHRLKHQHVVHIHGYFIEPPYFGMVLELCACTVKNAAIDREHKDPDDFEWRVQLANQSASVLAFLHSQTPPVIHRDIKWANFLISLDGQVKLCDFGEAVEYKEQEMEIVGSPIYMAPELLEGKHGVAVYGPKVDCYAYSLALWELFHAQSAFSQFKSHFDVLDQVLMGLRPTTTTKGRVMPTSLMTILERAWHQDPAIRSSAKEIKLQLEEFANQDEIKIVSERYSECSGLNAKEDVGYLVS